MPVPVPVPDFLDENEVGRCEPSISGRDRLGEEFTLRSRARARARARLRAEREREELVRARFRPPASDRLAEQRREFSDLELESFPFGHQTIQFGG